MSTTTSRGFTKRATNSPDYTTESSARNTDFDSIDAALGFKAYSASGAIDIKEGTAVLTKAGVGVMTLAAPTAGAPAAGGDDGKVLRVISATAQAHTLTQSSDGFNAGGSGSDVGTFGGAIGDGIVLVAYNAKWLVVSKTNVTLG
jgi:hypothetical protein